MFNFLFPIIYLLLRLLNCRNVLMLLASVQFFLCVNVVSKQNLYYCNKCGTHGRSSTKTLKLAKQRELPTTAGKTFIGNVKLGKLPFGYYYDYSIVPH